MTAIILQVINNDQTIEVFINDKNCVYIGEAGEDNPYSTCVTISFDDWQQVKEFIDSQFKLIQ